MAQWIGIGLTMLFGALALAVMWGKIQTQMDNSENELKTLRNYHKQHFDTIKAIENNAAAIGQQMHDHEKIDMERYERIETMLGETRQDIKTLLSRISPG